jgi:hypothetical protein
MGLFRVDLKRANFAKINYAVIMQKVFNSNFYNNLKNQP